MAWNIKKNILTGDPDIVIDGFEKGIADSPYEGIADMRNVNITTSPKQANVEFATAAVTLPPTYTAVAFSSATNDVFTTASTSGFYTGMALTIVTVSGAGSGTAGLTYYVGDITATTFKLYADLQVTELLDVTDARTGTFTVPTFGTPSDSVSSPSDTTDVGGANYKHTFIMTTNGYVWYLTFQAITRTGGTIPINSLQFLGNVAHSTAGSVQQTGLAVWKGYLFAFMSTDIDYLDMDFISSGNPSDEWVYGWEVQKMVLSVHSK